MDAAAEIIINTVPLISRPGPPALLRSARGHPIHHTRDTSARPHPPPGTVL
jgi:hypothetical protein